MHAAEVGDVVAEAITNAVLECREGGMTLPLFVMMVGRKGVMSYSRVEDINGDDAFVKLSAHDGEWQMPLNLMIIDADGEAVRYRFTSDVGLARVVH